MIRKTATLIGLILILSDGLQAQLKDPAISFSIEPTLSNRIMTYKRSVTTQFKDSINKMDRWRDAIGGQIMVSFSTSRTSNIFFGLQFQNFGYTRRRENLRFLDTIHPQIGVMNDLSQTGGNYVDFNVRYQYIALPFLISKRIELKNMKESKLQFLFGGSISTLINHDIFAQLRGFSTQNGKEFDLSDEEAEAGRFNANLQLGLRLENPLYGKNTFVFVQPNIYLPVLKANYGFQRAQLYVFSLQLGIMMKLKEDKAK